MASWSSSECVTVVIIAILIIIIIKRITIVSEICSMLIKSLIFAGSSSLFVLMIAVIVVLTLHCHCSPHLHFHDHLGRPILRHIEEGLQDPMQRHSRAVTHFNRRRQPAHIQDTTQFIGVCIHQHYFITLFVCIAIGRQSKWQGLECKDKEGLALLFTICTWA